jgi:hypothetical protein
MCDGKCDTCGSECRAGKTMMSGHAAQKNTTVDRGKTMRPAPGIGSLAQRQNVAAAALMQRAKRY